MMRYVILLALLLCLPVRGEAWQVVGGGSGGGTPSISYESYSSNSGTGTDVTFSAPSGTASGDLLIMFINDDTGGGTTASGWTQIQYVDQYSSADAVAYYKIATGSDTPAATLSSSADWAGMVVRLSKTSGTWNIDASTTDTGGLSIVFTDITVGDPGIYLVFWGSDDDATVSTPPADMTEIAIVSTASSKAGGWILATTGSTGKSLYLSSGENAGIAIAVGLQ